jgi:hypothetical protein
MGLGITSWNLNSDDGSTFTGGTIDNLTVTGSSVFNTLYATQLSGGTIYSGDTNLWDIITGYMTPSTTGYTYDSIGVAVSDETTAITSGTTKLSFRMPYAFQLTGITAYLRTSGSTATIVDVNSGSTSLLSSAITISANGFLTNATNIVSSLSSITEDAIINVDIDSAGTSAAGLKLWLEGYRLQVALGAPQNTNPTTFVQNGLNTYTGGTAQYPTVNVSALTIANLIVSGNTMLNVLDSDTIYSGGTDLQNIINSSITGVTSGITGSINVNGLNTYTGGTIANQTINISAATLSSLNVSGTSILTTLSAGTLSAGTIYSGSTPLSTIIQTIASEYATGSTSGGTGSDNTPIGTIMSWHKDLANTPALPSGWLECNGQLVTDTESPYYNTYLPNLNGPVSAVTWSHPLNGGFATSSTTWTEGYFLRGTTGTTGTIQVDKINTNVLNVTTANGGSGGGKGHFSMTTGGLNVNRQNDLFYDNNDLGSADSKETRPRNFSVKWIIKIKNTSNTIDTGGTSYFSAITVSQLSATTYFSGATSFETILGRYALSSHTHSISGITNLQGSLDSKANLSGATFTGNVSVPSLSATTLISGSTDVSLLFATPANITDLSNRLATKANLSGATFTSGITAPSLSATTLSGGTIFSGSTDVSSLFRHTGSTLPFEIGFALSDEITAITSASTATLTAKIPFSGIISSVYFSLGTSGSTLSTFDVKNNGVTIFSTKPTIDANEFGTDTAATSAVITATTLNRYDVLTFFIDGAGTGAKGCKAWILGNKTS